MTKTLDAITYWVCVDCYEVHHGIREHEETTAETARRIVRHGMADVLRWLGEDPYDGEPLSRIPEDAEVTAGLLFEEHDDDCPNRKVGEWVVDCDCERMTFTWLSCDGCGSTLGGAREALTVWTKREA
jgi:hypothetical protein